MNSELEKLIEKYRITVNGLADLEGDYEKVIKERGFVTLNGLLVESNEPAGEGTENAVNTENTPVVESDASHNEPTPVVPAPSDNSVENTPVAPAPVENPSAPVENPGVTPVTEGPVSNDTNLGTEVASGERSAEPVTDTEESSEENSSEEEGEPVAGRKPKKKKN